jgi:hypothetical protein
VTRYKGWTVGAIVVIKSKLRSLIDNMTTSKIKTGVDFLEKDNIKIGKNLAYHIETFIFIVSMAMRDHWWP